MGTNDNSDADQIPTFSPDAIVSLNTRYSAVWAEVNTRITQRQNALQIYVTLSSGLLAILGGHLGNIDDIGCLDKGSDHFLQSGDFSFLIPIISLKLAWLNIKHEKTIHILRSYLKVAEKKSPTTILGYHTSAFFKTAQQVRTFHDLACALVMATFNILGAIIIIDDGIVKTSDTLFFLYCILAIFSIYSILKQQIWPNWDNVENEPPS